MDNVKYILIVSQYYYSHHCFVVSAGEENFREKALTLIERLEDYKRGEGIQRDYHYGSPRENAYTDINVRWNVNDVGDIYFIPCQSLSDAIRQTENYNTNFKYQYRLRCESLSKKYLAHVKAEIAKHHRYDDIKKILGEIFEIL